MLWANVAHAQDSETPPDGQPPGYTGPEVVVNGIRQPALKLFDAYIPNIPFVSGQFIFADEPEGPVRNQHQCTRKNALREAGTDQTAVDIEEKIKVQLDYPSREYGSAVIGDFQNPENPSFRNADLSRGETWAEARAAGRDAPKTIISIPTLGTFERIVAVVHSHPRVGVPDYEANFLPSDNDWKVYRTLQSNYPSTKLVPEYAFSHYIIGPDGKIRQYRQDAGQPTRPTSGIQNRC
ncbi:hypothetical protein [Sphingomonas sp. SORGH_AS_0870]|uniref:hypothetical protein n=1 Tax=Sphingomonas sp. SORGH_AS_0870 TaxID=3041801 RepID=UPI00286CA461|nr:hypothetical protein [Sphingomonas sp. SORGH_AS_0870]